MCKDIIAQVSESSGKPPKELIEEIGLTTDEEYQVAVDQDRTTKMRKGEL